MEKIQYDNSTYLYKTRLGLTHLKESFVKEANEIIEERKDINKTDGLGYLEFNNDLNFTGKIKKTTNLDIICQEGIDKCKELYIKEKRLDINLYNVEIWINVVRSKDPLQINFVDGELSHDNRYHVHTEINKQQKKFSPIYTFVYYIQMPDIMEDDDGYLFIQGENGLEYRIMPAEDDLIIMNGDIPHSPNNAPKATIDRIVMAGNIRFDYVKKEKSLF
jgi:hypothetical protein